MLRPGNPARDPDYGCAGRDRPDNDRPGADFCALPDPDGTKDNSAGPEDNAVLDGRVALDILERCAAQHHPHIDEDIVADLGSLADNDPHAMVDDYPPADHGTGMDLNSREEPADVGDEPGTEFQVMGPEPVGPPVEPEGMESRVTDEDFKGGAGGGISGKRWPAYLPGGGQKPW